MSQVALVGVFARALEQEGLVPGREVTRDFMDDAIMVVCEVGPRSVENYLRLGEAYGYWRIATRGAGRGGRGTVEFLGTQHEGAVQVA